MISLKALGNRAIFSDDNFYDERRKVWNGAIDRRPRVIIACESEADVIAGVLYAKENNLTVSIRGGGHHLAGTAVCDDGVMIDLSNMRDVRVDVDRKVAIVSGGALLADIDKETQKYGLAMPTGTVSETGIAGLALSGGLGYLRRKHGLSCDNLVGARIVTADGELLSINKDEHEDLFWAIRGGGGNFGVVTSFEFSLHEIGPDVLAVDVIYDYKDAKEILKKAQIYLHDAPDEVSFNFMMVKLPPDPNLPEILHHKKVIMLLGMYAGEITEGYKEIQPLRELADPIVDQTGVIPYESLQRKLDPMVPSDTPIYGTSLFFSALDDSIIHELLTQIDRAPETVVLTQLWALGGKMNRVNTMDTAFAIRDAQFALLVDVMSADIDRHTCEKWVDSLYSGLLPFSHKNSSYLNAITINSFAKKNTFAMNYDRLLDIKRKYDPNNIFRHNHNIDPNE